MEQRITHACGHDQLHQLTGYASQQERKASWLRTTQCRTCFVATKRSEELVAVADQIAAVAHLDLPALSGSDRQVAWATTIRARRLAAILVVTNLHGSAYETCLQVTNAKWWIDHRDLADDDLLNAAAGLNINVPRAA